MVEFNPGKLIVWDGISWPVVRIFFVELFRTGKDLLYISAWIKDEIYYASCEVASNFCDDASNDDEDCKTVSHLSIA